MAHQAHGPVINVNPSQQQEQAKETKVGVKVAASMPPASADIDNAKKALVGSTDTAVATINEEGRPLFALSVAPSSKTNKSTNRSDRSVKEQVQEEAPNFRELGKRYLV